LKGGKPPQKWLHVIEIFTVTVDTSKKSNNFYLYNFSSFKFNKLLIFSDLFMQLNLALFEFNGNTGFLLKPECMRRKDRIFDPFSTRIDGVVSSTLKIRVSLLYYFFCCYLNIAICIRNVK